LKEREEEEEKTERERRRGIKGDNRGRQRQVFETFLIRLKTFLEPNSKIGVKSLSRIKKIIS
jgi:hypothetical protein